MEIKFKDNPVTIKTVEVGGKKLTKQFLQQIPLERYEFYKIGDEPIEYYSYKFVKESTVEEIDNFIIDVQLIGWINVLLEKESFIANWLNRNVFVNVCDAYSILFINNSGELRRGYIHKDLLINLSIDDYPQLYI